VTAYGRRVVIGTILGILVIIALFVGLGWFINRTHERSQQRFDDNNRAGTLRTEPYRRPQRRPRHDRHGRDDDRDVDEY
jgi:uncharacterized membrane protein